MAIFKDQATGNYITKGLFLEFSYGSLDYAIYTLKEEDHEYRGKLYHSIKRLYLEIGDPTEYEFATQCFHGWAHWKRICDKTTILHPYIEEWRAELEVKLRSQGVKRMMKEATSDSKSAPSAAKWLADRGWSDKKTGRPSNEQVEREVKTQARIKTALDDDLARIRELKH